MDAREQWRRELGWRDRGRAEGGGISNMPGQMHGPTVVCHSYRFRSFRYSFPLNASSSPRFPPRDRLPRLPLALCLLYPAAFVGALAALAALAAFSFSLRVSRACENPPTPSRSPLPTGRISFFLSLSCNYSIRCCMLYTGIARGILFTMFARGLS
jgi:hypothetical protein